jgi:hypothetical protein
MECTSNFARTFLYPKRVRRPHLPPQRPQRGCPITSLFLAVVILSPALGGTRNLMDSITYRPEILRLTPQNDVVGQPQRGDVRFWILDLGFIQLTIARIVICNLKLYPFVIFVCFVVYDRPNEVTLSVLTKVV